MKLNNQRRMVADMMGVGLDRVKFDNSRIADIKEAITKIDLRSLIKDNAISILPKSGISRARSRKILKQKSKGKGLEGVPKKAKSGRRLQKKEHG